MRKINKSPDVPATLVGATEPTSATGVLATIYKADDVRKQLLEDQHFKCAYCECDLNCQYNDVEHYRPKSQYYWLGHEWNNLLYACNLCNRTFKKAQFPLKDETKKVVAPSSLIQEEPLIVNPVVCDPSIHIKFRRYEAVGMTPEGIKTIEIFHLNDRNARVKLISGREELYELYTKEENKKKIAQVALLNGKMSQDVYDLLISLCDESLSILKSTSHEFSGMLISQIN